MARAKSDGHIWGLEFSRYVCFLFRGNRAILAEIKQIPYLTLEIQGQGHDDNPRKSKKVIYRSWSLILPKKNRVNKSLRRAGGGDIGGAGLTESDRFIMGEVKWA